MGAQKWFKFYGQEYLSDPKIDRLTPQERSCWLTLLCLASMSDGTIRYLTAESLLNKSGITWDPYHPEEWERTLGVLNKFKALEMIDCQENGDIILMNWEKRQETNLTGAERVKNFRERQKNKKSEENQGSSDGVTHDVTNVTLDKNRIDKSREEVESEVPSDDSQEQTSKKPKFSEEDMRLTNLLIELITKNTPDWTLKGNIETWAEHIEKLHRIDKRTYEQIEFMIRWTQADSFWRQNILSTAKLREKFNDLIPKLKASVTKTVADQQKSNKPKML